MAGACMNTGMDQVPLSWQELESWQSQQGFNLNPWELSIIRRASVVYVQQLSESIKVDCPPPGKVVEQDQKELAQHIKGILR